MADKKIKFTTINCKIKGGLSYRLLFVPCRQGTFYFVLFTFSSVFGNIRAGHSIIPFGTFNSTLGTFIIPFGVDIITDGGFNIFFGFDIITAVFNKTPFGFYKFIFGGHKAPIGSNNIVGRHSNLEQTPRRRSQFLVIWK